MRHGRRMGHEAFDAAERFGEGEDTNRVDETPNFLDPASEFEAEHCAETALLLPGDFMAWMRRQTRIVDGAHLRLRFKEGGDRPGVPLLALDTGEQCPHPAQRLIRVEGGA